MVQGVRDTRLEESKPLDSDSEVVIISGEVFTRFRTAISFSLRRQPAVDRRWEYSPFVRLRTRLQRRSESTKPSSNLSTPSRMERNRSSGLRTREKALRSVSEMLSITPECSGFGGWATCWCMWTCCEAS